MRPVDIGERIRAGLENARRNGTRSGRPIGRKRTNVDAAEVVRRREQGQSWRDIATGMGVGIGTIFRAYRSFRNADNAFQ
jgi:DNA invertase Pin-like site-specific DNA recombinase